MASIKLYEKNGDAKAQQIQSNLEKHFGKLPNVFKAMGRSGDFLEAALKVSEAAEPRLVKGAAAGGRKMIQIGGNLLEFFLLPWGAIQVTLGAPFGFFSSGVNNIVRGSIAPVKMVGNMLVLPFSLFGVNL